MRTACVVFAIVMLLGGATATGRGGVPRAGDASTARTVEVRVPGVAVGEKVGVGALRHWRAWLIRQGYAVDRCGVSLAWGSLVVDIDDPADVQRLTDAGFTVLREWTPAPLRGAALTDPQYFTPAEIGAMLLQVATDHPAIAARFAIGTTHEGRPIWAIEISDHPRVDEDEPAIQFNGQHHAREVATSHVVMDVVTTLTNGYGVDPQITAWVNAYKTVCVPMVNPDGVDYVFNFNSLWRKNRQTYPPNCVGVDLNRNYPYLWGPGCGSSGVCSSNIYRGPSVASEIETQALIGLTQTYHFTMATSYHSFGRLIDYPYACSDGSPAGRMPEHAVIDEMMNGVADAIDAVDGVPRYTVFSPVPLGGVNGDDTSWYYAHMGAYPFIIEVGTSFEPAFSAVAGIVNRNRAGWQHMYQRLGQARIDVHVTAQCAPTIATVELTDFVYDTGELPRQTTLPFGRWSYIVPANAGYTVRASRPGFVTRQVTVSVGNAPAFVDIDLHPFSLPTTPVGDMDQNCIVNGADIPGFTTALLAGADPAQIVLGDFTRDCLIDLADLPPFVAALLNGDTCP
ncbi:MAG: M14 family metallopeptidase [Phycisphaerae bacterium]